MAVWKLKSCPRCNGDLFIQREQDGWYEECLLCGYQRDVSNLVTVNTLGQVKIKGQSKLNTPGHIVTLTKLPTAGKTKALRKHRGAFLFF